MDAVLVYLYLFSSTSVVIKDPPPRFPLVYKCHNENFNIDVLRCCFTFVTGIKILLFFFLKNIDFYPNRYYVDYV